MNDRYISTRKQASGRSGAARPKHERARALRRRMTHAESLLWSAVRRNGLGIPCRRQHVIAGFIVDFFLPAARLIVEVDGEVHLDRQEGDQQRDEVLRGQGFEVVRFTNEEVRNELISVLAQLRVLAKRRTTSTMTPSPLPDPC